MQGIQREIPSFDQFARVLQSVKDRIIFESLRDVECDHRVEHVDGDGTFLKRFDFACFRLERVPVLREAHQKFFDISCLEYWAFERNHLKAGFNSGFDFPVKDLQVVTQTQE